MPTGDCRTIREELNRNKKNRTFGELKAILEDFGWTMHPRTKGDHRPFTKPDCEMGVSIPQKKGPVLVAYVRKVVRALEECCDE
jgi:predicted RNA binding protein YcfA (HicA-like mRNA interferase family)